MAVKPRCPYCNAQGIDKIAAHKMGPALLLYCGQCGAIHGVVPINRSDPEPKPEPEPNIEAETPPKLDSKPETEVDVKPESRTGLLKKGGKVERLKPFDPLPRAKEGPDPLPRGDMAQKPYARPGQPDPLSRGKSKKSDESPDHIAQMMRYDFKYGVPEDEEE